MASTPRAQSLHERAIMAVLLMIGFYGLALAVVIALLFSVVAQFQSGHVFIKFVLLALIGAVAILVAIFPRPDRFDPPWPQLDPSRQPELFRNIRTIADQAQQSMPVEVYLLPEANAWVASRGGFMGMGSRRVMGIGLPLMYFLSVDELTAVLAHEFGHYYGGDTRLGPWIYKTRGAIGRTLANLSNESVSFMSAPFNAYGRMFLRITHGISRQQEYTADSFAASIAGPDALKSALARLSGYGNMYLMYWTSLVEPTLRTGFLPRIDQGLTQAFSSEVVKHTVDQLLDNAMKVAEDEFDTHPPLRDRIAALEALPMRAGGNGASALSLLDGADTLWQEVLRSQSPAEFSKLQGIEWPEVSEKVFIEPWRMLRDRNREHLAGLTAGELPKWFERGEMIRAKLVDHYGTAKSGNEQIGLLLHVAVAAVSLALVEADWTFIADPGRGTFFARGEKAVGPDDLVRAVATGSLSSDQWLELGEVIGIRDIPLDGRPRQT